MREASEARPDVLADALCRSLVDLGSIRAALYLVDYDHATLQPVAWAPRAGEPDPLPVTGSLAGRAFLTRGVQAAGTDDGQWHVWVPVRERADQMGVVEMVVADPGHVLARQAVEVGLVAGQHLHSVSRYTDTFELVRRHRSMNLAADMQWSMLLPALSFETPLVSLAGTFEPAYEIGGDAFDYAAHDEVVDLCVLDAMGHGIGSTLASALTLGAYRFGRRQGLGLAELAQAIDEALVREWDGERFVTGHLARLDAGTGQLEWINAGHPPPLLVRRSKVVGELACEPCLPLGLGTRVEEVCRTGLEPGDRVLFYTDGAVEARDGSGRQLGVAGLVEVIQAELADPRPAMQVLRRMVGHVLTHREGHHLADDVTLVLLHWHPLR